MDEMNVVSSDIAKSCISTGLLVIDRTLFLPNRTELFFCRTIVRPTELCSAKTAERVRQMGHISAERSVRPNLRFGSVFAERVRGSVDHYP